MPKLIRYCSINDKSKLTDLNTLMIFYIPFWTYEGTRSSGLYQKWSFQPCIILEGEGVFVTKASKRAPNKDCNLYAMKKTNAKKNSTFFIGYKFE